MQKRIRLNLKWGLPLLFIGMIILLRWLPGWAEWYSRTCYPLIAMVLSGFSSLFPFPVGDYFILGGVVWLLAYPFYAWKKKRGVWNTVGRMTRFLMWIYVWFYVAWGINYFRLPFYERIGVEKAEFAEEEFQSFLQDYVERLGRSYSEARERFSDSWYVEPHQPIADQFILSVREEVNAGYGMIAARFRLAVPSGNLYPKYMLLSRGMSYMGVSGYMGPYFAEFNLNRDLLNVEYPFTYAHELAHRLGIASEAEANFYATLVTTRSGVAEMRFSGYFSILGYVLNNARRLLSEEEYKEVLGRIPAEVIEMYKKHWIYWREKYNPSAGKIQHKVYNAYLKSNRIEGGTKDYSEVVGMLVMMFRDGK